MPFTVSHAAAAVPFWKPLRRYGVLSALVIGSFTPDLVYFSPFVELSLLRTHTLASVLWFNLPAGLLAYGVYHLAFKSCLVDLAPHALRARLPDAWLQRPPDVSRLGIVASLLLGTTTHLLWDAFTHSDGFYAQKIPWLSIRLEGPDGYDFRVFSLLQHTSTVVGGAVLAYWILRWWRRTSPTQKRPTIAPDWLRRSLLVGSIAIASASGLVVGSGFAASESGIKALRLFLGFGIRAAGAGLLLCMIVVTVVWHVVAHVRREPTLSAGGSC